MNVGGIGTDQIQSMLAQLRNIGSRASAPASAAAVSPLASPLANPITTGGVQPSSVVDFSKILQGSLNQIKGYQDESQNLGQRFTMGDSSVSLSDVMMASQKASLSMQTAVQVRNKLVSAYQTIMNMQI
jgi:flagellar hook-basal body complex protein FliE